MGASSKARWVLISLGLYLVLVMGANLGWFGPDESTQRMAPKRREAAQIVDSKLLVNGSKVDVRTFDRDEPSSSLAAMLSRAEALDRTCRSAIAVQLEAGGDPGDDENAAWLYLEHHLQELPELAGKLGHAGAGPSNPVLRWAFVERLQLASICSVEEDGEFVVYFDYTIGRELTQYVLTVSLDYRGTVMAIDMES